MKLRLDSNVRPRLVWKRETGHSSLVFRKKVGTPVGWSLEEDPRKARVIAAAVSRLRSGSVT